MDNLIKDLQDIYSLWTFKVLDKLEYDGNGTYTISKKEVDLIKTSIFNKNISKEDTKLINAQGSKILVSLMSENLIT